MGSRFGGRGPSFPLRGNPVNAKSGNWVNTEETGGLTVREWLSSHFLPEFKTEIGLT